MAPYGPPGKRRLRKLTGLKSLDRYAVKTSATITSYEEGMGESFISLSRIAWLIGIAVLVMAANIAVSVLYMVVYSYLINPGHEKEYYDAHVQVAAPYCSIVAGIPLMFLAGWWVGGWWQGEFAVKSALVIWFAYAAIDIVIVLAAGLTPTTAILVAVSLVTKLAAVYLGALFAGRRVSIT